jgi:hypothetical protein
MCCPGLLGRERERSACQHIAALKRKEICGYGTG